MTDDLLGQQHDDIARLRYELAKTIERAPDFQDCKSAMDVYWRLLELGEEAALREELHNGLARVRPGFDGEPWIDQLVQAIRDRDQSAFDQVHQKALMAAIFK